MKYLTYNLHSYNLHFIKTDKFKTISMLVNFKRPLKKEEVTIRNFLALMLMQSSKNYPNRRLLAIKAEHLYDPNIAVIHRRLGNYSLLSFSLAMLNEAYTEPKMYEKTFAFLMEIIFNPHLKDKAFDAKSFKIVKNMYSSSLKSIKDDPQKYSLIRMLEEMDIKAPYAFRDGYLEDIKKITPKTLKTYYNEVINNDELDIFILGDLDLNEIKRMLKEKIKINTIKRFKGDLVINHQQHRLRIKKVNEEEKIRQSKLSIGCKLINLTDFEQKYIMPLYANILGGASYSKLFATVREKHSLAYYIKSVYIKADNLLLIYSGINKDNASKVLSLIKKEMNEIAKGNIKDSELDKAKKSILSQLDDVFDYPNQIINTYLLISLLKLDDLKTQIKKYQEVTIADLKRVAKKIKMDTVFLLYGGQEYEEN